jgi:hypothetical protein
MISTLQLEEISPIYKLHLVEYKTKGNNLGCMEGLRYDA